MQEDADTYEEATDALHEINEDLEELAETGKEDLSNIYN
jgi:hypothetical protein